jgi:hypothetical protein
MRINIPTLENQRMWEGVGRSVKFFQPTLVSKQQQTLSPSVIRRQSSSLRVGNGVGNGVGKKKRVMTLHFITP